MCHPRNINFSQEHILRRLRYFKEIHRPAQDTSPYKSGHCAGLTATYLYGKWVSLNWHPRIRKENEQWFRQSMQQLSTQNLYRLSANDVNQLDEFANKISYFQNPKKHNGSYRQGEYHFTMTNELGRKPNLEYTLAGSFKRGDLNTPNYYTFKKDHSRLTTPLAILSQPYVMVHIQCYQHASGFIADDKQQVYYYNANNKTGEMKFDAFNINQLEKTIFKAHSYQDEAVLAFRCFYFKHDTSTLKPLMYPKQEQILKNLSGNVVIQSPTDPKTSCSAITLAKHINCSKSYAFYKETNKNPCFDVDRWKHLGHSHTLFSPKEHETCPTASLSPAVPAASGPFAPEI